MVFLNYSTMQMVAKIVYYGPGLCGKTTNLKEIYKKTSPRSRGEMVSLETETDRTLFFDLLPMDVGVVGGFKTKFQLYTVPGQVFYNSTRKLVLRGVDGIVFVADSQQPMLEANRNSYENLVENLEELDVNIADVPLVFQYNKRDLPNVASIEELNKVLNTVRRPYVEAAALKGEGVFETLKEISKQTLVKLRAKAMDQIEPDEPEPEPAPPPPPEENEDEITFKVREPKNSGQVSLESAELLGDGDSMPGEVSFEEPREDGLPDVTGVDSEIMVPEDSFDNLDDDLGDFDLDFAEEDDLDEDSLTLDELDDPLDTGADLSAEAGEAMDMLDETIPDSIQELGNTEFDTEPGEEDISPPTVHLDIPLNLEDDEDTGSDYLEAPDGNDDTLPGEEETKDTAAEIDPDGTVHIHRSALAFTEPDEVVTESLSEETGSPEISEPEPLPAPEPEFMTDPEPEPEAPPVRARRPKKSAVGLSSSLEELESLATQAMNTKAKPGKARQKSSNVDSLLTGLVSSGSKKEKPDRFHVLVPSGFDKAQMNCVFLDENDNVLHTQLLKVNKQQVKQGKYRIRMVLDVEIDE